MNKVRALLEQEITEKEIEIDDIARAVHRVINRGNPPAGATWNKTVVEEEQHLEVVKWELYNYIEAIKRVLGLMNDEEGNF